jgi:hypothetical protein
LSAPEGRVGPQFSEFLHYRGLKPPFHILISYFPWVRASARRNGTQQCHPHELVEFVGPKCIIAWCHFRRRRTLQGKTDSRKGTRPPDPTRQHRNFSFDPLKTAASRVSFPAVPGFFPAHSGLAARGNWGHHESNSRALRPSPPPGGYAGKPLLHSVVLLDSARLQPKALFCRSPERWQRCRAQGRRCR